METSIFQAQVRSQRNLIWEQGYFSPGSNDKSQKQPQQNQMVLNILPGLLIGACSLLPQLNIWPQIQGTHLLFLGLPCTAFSSLDPASQIYSSQCPRATASVFSIQCELHFPVSQLSRCLKGESQGKCEHICIFSQG